MSIRVKTFNERNLSATDAVADLAGRLCTADGMDRNDYIRTGVRAADFSSELVFTTLERMGVIPEDGIDVMQFRAIAKAIVQESGVEVPEAL